MNTPPNSRDYYYALNEQSWGDDEYCKPIQDLADLCIGQKAKSKSNLEELCQNEENMSKFIVDESIKEAILNIKEMAPLHQEQNNRGLNPDHQSDLECNEASKTEELSFNENTLVTQENLKNTRTMETEHILKNDSKNQSDLDDENKNDQTKLQDSLENETKSANSQEIQTCQNFPQFSCPSQTSTKLGSEHITTPKVVSPPSTQIYEAKSNSSSSKKLENDQMQQLIEVGLKATRGKKHQRKIKSN